MMMEMKDFNIKSLAAALMLVAALAGCTDKNLVEEPKQAAGEKTYTMTITATKGDGEDDALSRALAEAGTTRALSLSDDGKTLNATWTKDDVVKVYNVTKGADLGGTLTAQSSGASTTLEGTLTGDISVGDELTLKFLSPDYDGQDGTLKYIAAHCDYAEATVTVASTDGGNITTTGAASFENQQAIVRFTLKNKADNSTLATTTLTVKANGTTYIMTRAAASSEFYVAMPAIDNKNVTLLTTDDADNYFYYRDGVTFANCQYYNVGVKMQKETLTLKNGSEVLTKNAEGKYDLGTVTTATTLKLSGVGCADIEGKGCITLELEDGTELYGCVNLCAGDSPEEGATIFTSRDATIHNAGTTALMANNFIPQPSLPTTICGRGRLRVDGNVSGYYNLDTRNDNILPGTHLLIEGDLADYSYIYMQGKYGLLCLKGTYDSYSTSINGGSNYDAGGYRVWNGKRSTGSSGHIGDGDGYFFGKTILDELTGDVLLEAHHEASEETINTHVTGTLRGDYKITIAANTRVLLENVTIAPTGNNNCEWAGITCLGDAHIYVAGTNTVKSFNDRYPAIYVPEGHTLAIDGYDYYEDNQVIDPILNAIGGGHAAGIGGGEGIPCGNIIIGSGTVNATGGERAAGIGSRDSYCGCIMIRSNSTYPTKVTATKGKDAVNSIGMGYSGFCCPIYINDVWVPEIPESPFTWPTP